MKNRINLFMLSGENDYLKTLLRDMHFGIINCYSKNLLSTSVSDNNYTMIIDKFDMNSIVKFCSLISSSHQVNFRPTGIPIVRFFFNFPVSDSESFKFEYL